MSMYYKIIVAMVVFSMVAMVVCVNSSGTLARNKKKYFVLLFLCIAAASLCEYFGICLQGTGSATRVLHIVVKAAELSIAPAIGFLLAAVIEQRFQKIIAAFLAVHACVEISSGIFGFIYRVDANSTYSHERFYGIYVAAYLLSLLYGIVIFARNMKKYQYNGMAFFCMITLFMLFGIIVQMCSSELKVVYAFIAMVALMLYVFTLEMIQQNDELTGLINRRGYENMIAHLEDKCVILMFDVDQFKTVNDRFGHKTGDLCLKEIGNALKGTYAKYGRCFRIGGDEFCVIMTKEQAQIDRINQDFFLRIAQYRAKYEWMPWVSLGYVFFDPQTDTLQDVLNDADRQMYRYKKAHRSCTEESQTGDRETAR